MWLAATNQSALFHSCAICLLCHRHRFAFSAWTNFTVFYRVLVRTLFAKKIVMKNHHLLLLTELRRYLRRDLEINWVIWFFKWAIPGLSFVYFRSFSEKPPYNFCSKLMWKNVHPVYGAGIWTHDPQITSLVPWPLDHGSRPAEL